jgi:hypothetical protein
LPALAPDQLNFAWDRHETTDSLKRKLSAAKKSEWLVLASWIMREAQTQEVWTFLTLQEISDSYPQLAPLLGKKRKLWDYLLKTARELGRL